MSFQRQLYDTGVLVSLRAPGASGVKSDHRIRDAAASHLGIDPRGMTGSKVIIPSEWLKPITGPVSTIRFHLREMGVPWSSNDTKDKARKEDGKWLVYQADLPDFEEMYRENRMLREAGVDNLVLHWPEILAERRATLGSLFDPEDYMSADELRAKFECVLEIMPLRSLEDVESDLRLRLPKSWAEDQIRVAKEEEARRVSNALAALADEVVSFVEDSAAKLRAYDDKVQMKECGCVNEGVSDPECAKCDGAGEVRDARIGNTFRAGPMAKNARSIRTRLARLNDMFDDPAIAKASEMLGVVADKIDSASDLRADDDEREEVAAELDKVAREASGATDRLNELMGDLH